jgi:hypothetical protein
VTKWKSGDTFTVTISVEKATKLHSWYAEITYDPTKLTVTGAQTIDTFLHRPYMVEVVDWSTPGLVVFRVDKGTDLGTSTGAGVLATISFKVKQTLYWTNTYPEINDVIAFNRVIIDFMCPDLHYVDSWVNPILIDITDPIYYKYKPVPGDLDMNGIVNELDLGIIAHEYGMLVPPAVHDVIVTGGSAGKIDLWDLVAVALNFNRNAP